MKIISLAEFEIKCNACKAKLAYTSEDIHHNTIMGVSYVKCPVCGNLIELT